MAPPPVMFHMLHPTARPRMELNRRRKAAPPHSTIRVPDERMALMQAIVERTGSNLYAVANTLLEVCLGDQELIDGLIQDEAFPRSPRAGRPCKDRSAEALAARAAWVKWHNSPHETRGPEPELPDE